MLEFHKQYTFVVFQLDLERIIIHDNLKITGVQRKWKGMELIFHSFRFNLSSYFSLIFLLRASSKKPLFNNDINRNNLLVI